MGVVGVVLKPKQYARLSNKVKYKNKHLYNLEHVVQSTIKEGGNGG